MNATKAHNKGKGMDVWSMPPDIRNQKYKVFDDAVLPDERRKRENEAYKAFGYKCPSEIPIGWG
ncbi:MAG: hypothetical protein FWH47_08095 [Methanomassiliicoccaceae archaeon]|nr:hypothetical protein [Methanomassiliicoccaceae archaeon]